MVPVILSSNLSCTVSFFNCTKSPSKYRISVDITQLTVCNSLSLVCNVRDVSYVSGTSNVRVIVSFDVEIGGNKLIIKVLLMVKLCPYSIV